MRRYIVVFLLACLSVGSSLAAPVSRQAAQQIARNVFSAGDEFAPDAAEISGVIVQKWQGLPVIYAVNFSEGGFVLLSADDRARPVLGICREGAFDPKIHVPAFEWQMEEWSRQIHHIVRNQIPATEKIKQEWAKWHSPQEWLTACAEESTPLHAPKPLLPVVIVSPLLTTTWNQGCNYNANCPADGGGSCGRVWTGCGATAMAPPSYSLQSANFGVSTYLLAPCPTMFRPPIQPSRN
ncbi:MAG: Spi family protease inhibitor [Bacteroidetes bacterium]|nr:Spi family protease inhibitor [Bacteroidota bacterium]